MAQALEQEWRTYEQQRARLLESSEAKFALIHHDKVLGVLGSRREARRAGYQQLGNVPFLVHEITAVETPRRIISHTTGTPGRACETVAS